MKKLLLFITLISIIGCKDTPKNMEVNDVTMDSLVVDEDLDTLDEKIISDYDMSTVDVENKKEFKESLVKIEKEFGEQWGFCECVIKGDSINKAFSNPDLPDDQFDKLSERFDYIDEKCKAFRIQNPNVTPEERLAHEKKVRNCLKEAGIK